MIRCFRFHDAVPTKIILNTAGGMGTPRRHGRFFFLAEVEMSPWWWPGNELEDSQPIRGHFNNPGEKGGQEWALHTGMCVVRWYSA